MDRSSVRRLASHASCIASRELLRLRRGRTVPAVAVLFGLAVASVVRGATPPTSGQRPLTLLALVPDGASLEPTAVVVFSLARALTLFVPLVTVVLAAGTLAGEYEAGTLRTLQTLSVSRNAVVVGKFLARSAVVGSVVAAGLGVGALATWVRFGTVDLTGYSVFLVVSVVFALVLTGITVAVSTLVTARSRAVALSLGPFLLVAFLGVDSGLSAWLRTGLLVQPYQLLVAGAHDQLAAVPRLMFRARSTVPNGMATVEALPLTDEGAFGALLAWPVVLLTLAVHRYRRRDL